MDSLEISYDHYKETCELSRQGKKGDENYAIYTTIGRAGGQADGFAHVLEKL